MATKLTWERHPEYAKRQAELGKWYRDFSFDYLDLFRKKCICCSNTKENIRIEFDHIYPQQTWRIGNTTNVQPLCNRCNKSKGDSEFCRMHNKYLGIWNYLPNLDDIETLLNNLRKL